MSVASCEGKEVHEKQQEGQAVKKGVEKGVEKGEQLVLVFAVNRSTEYSLDNVGVCCANVSVNVCVCVCVCVVLTT